MPTVRIIEDGRKAKSFAAPVRYRPPADDLNEVFERPLNYRLAPPKPDEGRER